MSPPRTQDSATDRHLQGYTPAPRPPRKGSAGCGAFYTCLVDTFTSLQLHHHSPSSVLLLHRLIAIAITAAARIVHTFHQATHPYRPRPPRVSCSISSLPGRTKRRSPRTRVRGLRRSDWRCLDWRSDPGGTRTHDQRINLPHGLSPAVAVAVWTLSSPSAGPVGSRS